MNIEKFFNVKDEDHIRAYRHLQETGMWPEKFLPDDIELNPTWLSIIQAMMTNQYVKSMLDDTVYFWEFFKPENVDHLAAYSYYLDNVEWPEYFLPKDIYFREDWKEDLDDTLARQYVKQAIIGNISGIKALDEV